MMGAAMLKRHQFVQSLWALYRLVVSSITFVRHLYVGESGVALVLYYFFKSFCWTEVHFVGPLVSVSDFG